MQRICLTQDTHLEAGNQSSFRRDPVKQMANSSGPWDKIAKYKIWMTPKQSCLCRHTHFYETNYKSYLTLYFILLDIHACKHRNNIRTSYCEYWLQSWGHAGKWNSPPSRYLFPTGNERLFYQHAGKTQQPGRLLVITAGDIPFRPEPSGHVRSASAEDQSLVKKMDWLIMPSCMFLQLRDEYVDPHE